MNKMRAPIFSLTGRRVFVAGHRGMVGSALVRRMAREDCEILTAGRDELDLRQQGDVEGWVAEKRPSVVFVAAATVGGIVANDTRPAEFIYDNLAIEANLIEGARRIGVEKLMFLGSSCIYPRLAPQPMSEDALLTGPLEPTNQWYAIAKIAGLMMCAAYRRQYGCDYISAMPTNVYGPGDNFHPTQSHVVAALIAKNHRAKVTGAKEVEIWGTGAPPDLRVVSGSGWRTHRTRRRIHSPCSRILRPDRVIRCRSSSSYWQCTACGVGKAFLPHVSVGVFGAVIALCPYQRHRPPLR